MTEIKPATDADVSYWEKVASDTPFDLTFFQLIARIRQEQRRAEAAERVVEAVKWHCDLSRWSAEALAAYDAAKAAGFPEEG